MSQNKVSVSIPEADYAQVVQKLTEVQALLKPHVVALTSDERRALPKMGDKTFAFVEKALSYSKDKPALTPGFIEVAEWEKDSQAQNQLVNLYRMCEQLCSSLDDTAMLCGSEAYTNALGFYNSIKQAAKMNVPDAKPIYEDLAYRFPGRSMIKPQPEPVQ